MNWFNNLPERVRTVLIWAPIPIIMILISPFTAWIIFALLAFGAVWEWRNIILQKRELFYTRDTQVAIFGVIATMILALFNIGLALALTVALAFFLAERAKSARRVDIFLSQLVPSFVGIGAYAVRSEPNGLALLGLMLIITTFSDSAAYFVGKAIGKTKFAPTISPNKTWEGAIGGWVFAIIAAWIYVAIFLPSIADWPFFGKLFFFWILAFAGQMGDLGESYIKRKYDVKDSGTIFPGHGGVMDRFDSFSAVIAVMSLVGLFVHL